VRWNKLLLVGGVLALVGAIGAGLTFFNSTPTDGQTFVDQIDISTGVDKFQDYEVGDEVIIVDEIVRMEENDDGNTHVWLESIADKNLFFMPFLMTPKLAAQKIFKKLSSNNFEIFFPKKLILPMKLFKFLPYQLYFFLMKKFIKVPK